MTTENPLLEQQTKNAVAYIRVSTQEQDLGPEAQRRDIERWCQANGYELVQVCEDRLSGATLPEDSPGLLAAFEACKQHGSKVLIVAKRDRLARDKMRVAMIEHYVSKEGIKLISAAGEGNGDGPEDFLIRSIMDVFSEYERLCIKFRTKKALAVKKSRGEKTGGDVPFGFDVDADGKLVPNQSEQSTIATMKDLRRQGVSFTDICTRLTVLDVPTKRGNSHWHPTQVQRLVKRAEQLL